MIKNHLIKNNSFESEKSILGLFSILIVIAVVFLSSCGNSSVEKAGDENEGEYIFDFSNHDIYEIKTRKFLDRKNRKSYLELNMPDSYRYGYIPNTLRVFPSTMEGFYPERLRVSEGILGNVPQKGSFLVGIKSISYNVINEQCINNPELLTKLTKSKNFLESYLNEHGPFHAKNKDYIDLPDSLKEAYKDIAIVRYVYNYDGSNGKNGWYLFFDTSGCLTSISCRESGKFSCSLYSRYKDENIYFSIEASLGEKDFLKMYDFDKNIKKLIKKFIPKNVWRSKS